MARPKKMNLPMPQSATDALNQAEQEHRQAEASTVVKIPLPNGKFGSLELFIDSDYRSGNYTSIFADANKFMKEPREECMYAWVAYGRGIAEASLMGKVRSGMYRPVSVDEINDDMDIPVVSHKVAGQEFVTVYDVALVEVQPHAVKRLYKWREQTAVTKTIRNQAYETLRSNIERETGGAARVEFDLKETNIG